MAEKYLDFEKPIIEIEQKINELRTVSKKPDIDFSAEIKKLHKKANRLKNATFKNLTGWQQTLLARHPERPYTLDYVQHMTTDFVELEGDRRFGMGHSIVGGFARFEGETVMIIGHQKGRDLTERMNRNFGSSNPEGYRKAMRLIKLAEKFNKPVITLLDTPGAYPGMGAEERGQSEAIAANLFDLISVKVPIVVTLIGEGGSGGALALGVGDRIMMLEYSVYSVISPEGCAAILWDDCTMIEKAAETLRLTSKDILELGVIDEIVKEPIGGAHRDPVLAASILRRAIRRHLNELRKIDPKEMVAQRKKKFRNMGVFEEY
ncbi:MAG: acetyl-CoA carboxylase carboxyltransferase subunit alpha [Nitrospinae bacterium]|nr:acetyl-CoA carboxylase carboxyltransferase subunit alpha [Nitrospinota bacterium]